MDSPPVTDLVPSEDIPDLLFEEGSYSLTELLESHLLPVVVQYDAESLPLPFNEFNFDLSQPLLLYKKRNIQKVSATSLCIRNERYEEVGESLLIPEDYKGWFSVLPRVTGQSIIDDNVPHFSKVEELANSNTDRFLIGGTKRLTGLEINDRSAGVLDHKERHIAPGEILTREKIYFGETKKKTRLFRKPKYIVEKFLMCRDETEREVLLPFEQQGIFYQVSHKGGKAHKNVLQMSDIVARKMTPRLIKLVYGRFPVTPCAFTGLMRAESSDIETSVIACTLVNTKNILLEVPVASFMRYRIALTNNTLRLNACYKSAISLCAERANTYMRNIKVCVNGSTDDDQGHPVSEDFTTKRNRSNSVDIDAIQSSPRKAKSNTIKKNYSSLKRPSGLKTPELYVNIPTRDLRLSESLSSSVSLRPGRCFSTGRMSFCLGNNYLTVPMYYNDSSKNRNSGNNNSINQSVGTSKVGSRISFDGNVFEEDNNGESEFKNVNVGDSEKDTKDDTGEIPLPLPCTNITSYINQIELPTPSPDSDVHDYIPASTSSNRRPSSNAPEVAPPPLPVSSSTSVVSSGSLSSIDEHGSQKGFNDSFEYAIPKIGEPSKVTIKQDDLNVSVTKQADKQSIERRPSTFTFSEGCSQLSRKREKLCSPFPGESENDFEEDGVIYENIKTLIEEVTAKEELLKASFDHTDVNSAMENAEIVGFVYKTTINRNEDENILKPDHVSHRSIGSHERILITDKAAVDTLREDLKSTSDCCQSIETKNRVRKCGVTSFELPTLTGELTTVTEEFLNEEIDSVPDGELLNTADGLCYDNGIATESDNANGKLWLSGLKRSTETDIHLISPQYACDEEDIELMSTDTIVEKLKLIGIKDTTLRILTELGINGSVLGDILNGDTPLSECLVGVNLVDQQKISMFVRGWRPDMDYI